MTQDEIIEMWNSVIKYAPSEVRIAEFAKLVAAKAFQNGYEKALAQPEQESVGYWKEHAQGMQRDYDLLLADYEKLAQRTWVGLTDEDIYNLEGFYDFMTKEEFFDAIRGVEAKLKEKNT